MEDEAKESPKLRGTNAARKLTLKQMFNNLQLLYFLVEVGIHRRLRLCDQRGMSVSRREGIAGRVHE